jgi:hypothetical protein
MSDDHAYNAPDITPYEFLDAVYRDPTVLLKHRMQAASLLVQIYKASLPQVVIRIGGFPEYIDTWMCSDINDCITRTTPCPWHNIIRSIQGVNFRSCKDHMSAGVNDEDLKPFLPTLLN